jgi:hypothetical protein
LGGPHEVAALDGAAGSFDEAASFGDIAQSTSHAILDGKQGLDLSRSLWHLVPAAPSPGSNIIGFTDDGDILAGGLFGIKRWNIGKDN